MIKNLPARQETLAQSLGWEEHLEKGMVTFSSILAWKIPWTEEPGRPQASLVAQMVKNLPAMQEIWFNPQVGKIPWKREW